MRVLVLGSGGREHALAWRIRRDPQVEEVYVQPGNGGTEMDGFIPLGDEVGSPEAVAVAAKNRGISLIVIGPEALLAEGYGDYLRKAGYPVVGPDREGARLETSKIFAKEFMEAADVPTAGFSIADSAESVTAACKDYPAVLKLDGLAAGKGVVIAQGPEDVAVFCQRVWEDREFGDGPHRILVEEFIKGRELSYIGLCDGTVFVPLSSATDYKRAGDGDTGGNTGGMGSISPSPYLDNQLKARIHDRVVDPIMRQISRTGLSFRGVLYIGLMITEEGDPFVLEFNTRFGDPETQAVLLRLESNFTDILKATALGALSRSPTPEFSDQHSVYVVAAAEGYPGKPAKGDAINGEVESWVQVFYSGVKKEGEDQLVTSGGRVLGVGALGPSLEDARTTAYSALESIKWRGMHYRRDIGKFG